MNDRIAQALQQLFQRHRVVFWYDAKKELHELFESLELPGVEKVEILNNEFGLKHRLLREEPNQKFLLFHAGPEPEYPQHWLLDVQLANEVFRADQASLWLSELDLPAVYHDLAEQHREFFQSSKRRESLRKHLKDNQSYDEIRLDMVAVCAGSSPVLEEILEHLFDEMAKQKEDRFKLLERSHLTEALWEELKKKFQYAPEQPGLKDLALSIFQSGFRMQWEGQRSLSLSAESFLMRWKDSRTFEASFRYFAAMAEDVLNVESVLEGGDYRDFLRVDYFEKVEQFILQGLVHALLQQQIHHAELSQAIKDRRLCHWYPKYADLYDAVHHASEFLSLHRQYRDTNWWMDSLAEGIKTYAGTWYRLDQHYRKYIYHAHKSGQAAQLGPLTQQVEDVYSNGFLLPVNQQFQRWVDEAATWEAPPIKAQREFFKRQVQPLIQSGKRVCVIISDALRFEVGEEFASRIRQENRYTAELEPMLSVLPSYTQLGMAALLPHETLSIPNLAQGTVWADGQPTQGTENRAKLLRVACQQRAEAMTAEQFLELSTEQRKERLKEVDVLYLYHNKIDHVGDDKLSEGQTFAAAEEAMSDLVQLVRKAWTWNPSAIYITADHGFLYQHRVLEESDFSTVEAGNSTVAYRDRRFLMNPTLPPHPSLRHFQASALGLQGDFEVQMSKSIHRMRLQGSGSRYVHGGASLQEVVVPLIKVHRSRNSDVSKVEVHLVQDSGATITTGQLSVTFYQKEPVREKVLPRELRVGLRTKNGVAISDVKTLTFDSDSERVLDRETKVQFLLNSQADAVGEAEVYLIMEEREKDTQIYKTYEKRAYQIRRTMTLDFEF